MSEAWDLVVVGGGPAGSAAALGALAARPELRVLIVDRAEFPRDKACGDGIAPHVLDVLAGVGVHGLLDDWLPVRRLRLQLGGHQVERSMARPAWVVPREVFDARLVEAAVSAGAVLRHQRARTVVTEGAGAFVDDVRARVVVGADGAHSMVRSAVGVSTPSRQAFALRGYAPTPPHRAGRQVIVFGATRQPSYAWSFDRGDGLSNVGYGELLTRGRVAPTRQLLLDRLAELLPGATEGGSAWRGHHLPLSTWRFAQPDGPVLLAGDAAGLINPMTGEGIYYAVATGVLAGRAAAAAISPAGGGSGDAGAAGAAYRSAVRSLLGRHLRHTSAVSRLVSVPAIVSAGIDAAARRQEVFDDLVEVGLGRGLVTPRVVTGLAAGLARSPRPPRMVRNDRAGFPQED